MSTTVFALCGGPNEMGLQRSLFDNGPGEYRTVSFQLDGENAQGAYANLGLVKADGCATFRTIEVKITGLEVGFTSGEWLFKGFAIPWHQSVEGSFDIHDRTGCIKFEGGLNLHVFQFEGSCFGYDRAVLVNDKVVALLTTENKWLWIGSKVVIRGDSRGYVAPGLKEGFGIINQLCLPFKNGETDHIIKVLGLTSNGQGWVKPSRITTVNI